MNLSGKSKSVKNPKGIRRKDKDGRELAPRSIRKKFGVKPHYLDECSEVQLEKAGV
jgi:hypothetical protein